MIQTSYTQNMKAGRAGLIYDTGYNDFVTRLAQVEVPFGRFVCQGADISQGKLPQSAADVTALARKLGFSASTATQAASLPAGNYSSYKSSDAISVQTRGRQWVEAEGSWTVGGDVYVRHTANASQTALGVVRPDADTANASQLAGAKFINTGNAANGDLAVIEFDLV